MDLERENSMSESSSRHHLNAEGPRNANLGFYLAILTMVFAIPLNTWAQVGKFVSVDVPGASLTRATDVNNAGVIVGFFGDQTGVHGFLLNQGVFTAVDFPGALLTTVLGINDWGQLVGRFQTEEGVDHGFLFSNGVFRQIDFPGSIATQCHGINKKGQIVGRYFNVENSGQGGGNGLGHEHGFMLSASGFTSIDFPEANTTDAWKITDSGDVIGDWSDNGALQSGSLHGYILQGGQYNSFDFPGAPGTAGREINSSGQLVGVIFDKKCFSSLGHGFVRVNGYYSAFDFPGSACTTATGLNDSGFLVGGYIDSAGAQHGYVAAFNQK